MESNREVFMTSLTDGGRTFAPNQRVAMDACPCCKTALAIGPDKSPVHKAGGKCCWVTSVISPSPQRPTAGRTFSQPVIVSDDRWQIAGCSVSGPALAVGSDGTLRVLWYSAGSAGEPGLYWSESRDALFNDNRHHHQRGHRVSPLPAEPSIEHQPR